MYSIQITNQKYRILFGFGLLGKKDCQLALGQWLLVLPNWKRKSERKSEPKVKKGYLTICMYNTANLFFFLTFMSESYRIRRLFLHTSQIYCRVPRWGLQQLRPRAMTLSGQKLCLRVHFWSSYPKVLYGFLFISGNDPTPWGNGKSLIHSRELIHCYLNQLQSVIFIQRNFMANGFYWFFTACHYTAVYNSWFMSH